jgi:hypothetical protein
MKENRKTLTIKISYVQGEWNEWTIENVDESGIDDFMNDQHELVLKHNGVWTRFCKGEIKHEREKKNSNS